MMQVVLSCSMLEIAHRLLIAKESYSEYANEGELDLG